jgi:membrane associated rhomboid family serine protease
MYQYRPPLTKINKVLIITLVGLFLIHAVFHQITGAYFRHFFGLNGGMFLSGYIFQILTYPLMAVSIFELLFDCLILWFIGGELERIWGTKKYFSFLTTAVISGGVIFIGLSSFFSAWPTLLGPGALTYPLLIAYGILFPLRELLLIFFPVKAKYFCMIVLALQIYTGIFSPGGVQAWGNLGAIVGGVAWMVWQAKGGGKPKGGRKKDRKSNHLRLVEDEEQQEKPKFFH